MSYLFERGHKRQRRLQAARDQTAVTRAQVTDAERTLAFNVGQQFVSVLLAESTLQFALEDLKGFQRPLTLRSAIQGRRHQRRRLPEDQAATLAVSDRRLFRPAGEAQALVALRGLLGYDAVPANLRRRG
jgi:cobalt-zinc-cadmium efflux system outer membrane protein